MSKTQANNFIETMEKWFSQFPKLPKSAKETLVKIAPILSLVFGILGILSSVGGIGALTMTSPLAAMAGVQGVSAYGMGFVTSLFYLASSVLVLAAYPGLKANKIKGWNLLFWSEVVSFVGGLVGLSGIVFAVIGALIGFYILFQLKSHYK